MALPNLPSFIKSAFNLLDSDRGMLNAILRGGNCCGFEKITIADNLTVYSLTPTDNATAALISIEPNAAQVNKDVVIRFREDAVAPTITDGIPIAAYGAYEVKNLDNLNNFRFLSPESLAQTIQILYYK